jgi:ribonuclease-3
LYKNAFTHKSVSPQSNERLEFIGDSVIGMIVAEYLYLKYPEDNEGFLTRVRTKIVSSQALAKFAKELKFDNYIMMNEKAMNNGWNKNSRILEDTFEAFMGALFLDRGIDVAKKFFVNKMIKNYCDFEEVVKDTNYKDILMKFVQQKQMGNPVYKSTHEAGPDHSKMFTIQVLVNNQVVAEGSAKNKKAAEQNAAMRALKALELIE